MISGRFKVTLRVGPRYARADVENSPDMIHIVTEYSRTQIISVFSPTGRRLRSRESDARRVGARVVQAPSSSTSPTHSRRIHPGARVHESPFPAIHPLFYLCIMSDFEAANHRQRRTACPCRKCRKCADPMDGMQTRQTIRRHKLDEAEADARAQTSKTAKLEVIGAAENAEGSGQGAVAGGDEALGPAGVSREVSLSGLDVPLMGLDELDDTSMDKRDDSGYFSNALGYDGPVFYDLDDEPCAYADSPFPGADPELGSADLSHDTLYGTADDHLAVDHGKDLDQNRPDSPGGSERLEQEPSDLLSSSDDESNNPDRASGTRHNGGERRGRYMSPHVEDAPDEDEESPDEDGAPEGETFEVPEDDLLYTRLTDLLADNDLPGNPYASGDLPPALEEHPLLRRAYVQAFIAAAFHGATHSLVNYFLEGQRQTFLSLAERTGYQIPGLENMARTLRTVERRLGVDPDQHIIYYFLCTHCWTRRTAAELKELADGACTEPGCTGLFYKLKTGVDGKKHRVPIKPLSTTSLKAALQRIMLRPGKVKEFNGWRTTPEDEAGPKPPLTQDDWAGSNDPSYRLFDMFDGWRWRAIHAGLERRKGGRWGIEDAEVLEFAQRFVALPNGLVLMFNIDWCVSSASQALM